MAESNQNKDFMLYDNNRIVIIMSTFTYPSYTREHMQDMHKKDVERWKKMKEDSREIKIINEVNMFQVYIINLNNEGYANCTRSFYCIDSTYVSEIADKLRERFPDSKVVVNDSTIGSMILLCLFNYRSITVTWK